MHYIYPLAEVLKVKRYKRICLPGSQSFGMLNLSGKLETKPVLMSVAIATTTFIAGCSDGPSVRAVESGGGRFVSTVGDSTITRRLTGLENKQAFRTTQKYASLNHYASNGFSGRIESINTDLMILAPEAVPESGVSVGSIEDAANSSSVSTDSSSVVRYTDSIVRESGVDDADPAIRGSHSLHVSGDTQPDVLDYSDTSLDTSKVTATDLPLMTLVSGEEQIDLSSGTTLAEQKPLNLLTDTASFYVADSAGLSVLDKNVAAADATLIYESAIELSSQSSDGMHTHGASGGSLILTSTSHGSGYSDYWGYPGFWGTINSSIHRLSVEGRTIPSVVETANFDGQIISSRVVGEYIYLATRYFPEINDVSFSDQKRSLNTAFEEIDIDSVMPSYTLSDGSSVPLASSENCFVSAPSGSGYYQPDIITLAAINLNDLSISDSVCYLDGVGTL